MSGMMNPLKNIFSTKQNSPEPAAAAAVPAQDTPKKFNFGFHVVGQSNRTPQEQFQLVQHLLNTEINPTVSAHGGSFTLVDVRDNNVYVRLGGGCQGCGMANVTLKQGFEKRLRQLMPELNQLVDVTDHASGHTPYYPG